MDGAVAAAAAVRMQRTQLLGGRAQACGGAAHMCAGAHAAAGERSSAPIVDKKIKYY
jgi:hypothetical protein